jgi:hypothetical protein
MPGKQQDIQILDQERAKTDIRIIEGAYRNLASGELLPAEEL